MSYVSQDEKMRGSRSPEQQSKRKQASRVASSMHQASKKGNHAGKAEEKRSLQTNAALQKRSSVSQMNLMGSPANTVHSNQKSKQSAAQNSQKYFKNYALINEKTNQQNGNTVKVLDTTTPKKDQLVHKKHVYSLDSSTMKKGRSELEESKIETHLSFVEKFQNKQLNLKLPDYTPERNVNQSMDQRSMKVNKLQVGRMFQDETSPEDNMNSSINQKNDESLIRPQIQDFTDAFVNHRQKLKEEQTRFIEVARNNPNLVFDVDQDLNQTLNKYLSNQKELIQKDGNIKINGILIKGAPSLGTKFNPNFRDPYHAPCARPQSRGLTQGSILQMATKALAQIQSQSQSRSQGRIKVKIPNQTGPRQPSRRGRASNLQRRTISHGFSHGRRIIGVRGTKKQTTEKSVPQKQAGRKNTDIAKSLKSLSSQHTKHEHIIAEKVKIQGGGQDGQDKVQLNVKFNQMKQEANEQNAAAAAAGQLSQTADGYEGAPNFVESRSGQMRAYPGQIIPNKNKSFGRLAGDNPMAVETQLGAYYLVKSESSHKMMNMAQRTIKNESGGVNGQEASSKNLGSHSISKMDKMLEKKQYASFHRQSSGSFGTKIITRDASKLQETKSINNIKRSQALETNDSESDIRNVKNLRINIQNLNDHQPRQAQQTLQMHPKSVKEIHMQQYQQKNISQNFQPQKRAKSQENNSRAYRMKRIKQANQTRQMQNRPNNFSSTVQSSQQGTSHAQSAANTHNVQSLRKGQPIKDFMKQMQKLERNENLTPQFYSNTNSMNQSPVNYKTLHLNQQTASGANTGQSGFNSGMYLHGSNIPDLNSMDSLPTRPGLTKNAAGHTSAQLYGKQGHFKSRSKLTFQNVAPKVQSRNFQKPNATNESSQQAQGVMNSLDDKFKTEKMDLTISQQNTLRQEQSQLQKDKQLHSERLTKVTNNTVQLQNDQTFSGHGSFEMNQNSMPQNQLHNNSTQPNMDYNIQTINIGGPDDVMSSNLIVVSNDEQSHDGKHAVLQNNSADFDQYNIKRIILTQNQLSEPQCVDNTSIVEDRNREQESESMLPIKNSQAKGSQQSPINLKVRNADVKRANRITSNQNSPSMPGVTEYLNDSEFVEMFMKPKGIEIFNPDLLSSDKASRQQTKNYINYQNYQSANKMRSTNQKPLDPSEHEHQSSLFTQSHIIDSSLKQSRQVMHADQLGKQDSFNDSKVIHIVQEDQRAFKRFKTVNQKKRQNKQIGQNETIDIDEMHYTEISSNANSMDKSAILKQQKFQTQKTQVTQIADLDTKSLKIVDKKQIEKIPLSNQDLKARQKQMQEQQQYCATEISCDPYTEVNHDPNKKNIKMDNPESVVSMTEMAEKDLKISEKKFTDSIENADEGSSQVPRDDKKKIHFKSNIQTELMSDLKNNIQIQNQSQNDKKGETIKNAKKNKQKQKSRLSYHKEEQQMLSMDGRKLKDYNQSTEQRKHQRVSSIATPCSKDEVTEQKNSKAFSAMISDNLLDIHDLNQNYMQIDEMFSTSQDLTDHPVSSMKKGLMAHPDYLDGKSNRYRPIHQINVQLLSSGSNENKSNNPLNKSSCYEMRNSKQRDVGIQLSWQNSQMQNYQDKQSNQCKSDATARQNESYQKDLSQLVGGPKFSPPNSGFSKTTINQASLNITNREINDHVNIKAMATASIAKQSATRQTSERKSTHVEVDFLESMAEIQQQNELSMDKMKKFFDGMRRKQLLFEMLHASRRRLFKSPNPNDKIKILVGNGQEMEADTLLNGNIHTDVHKKMDSDLGITLEDEKLMLKNQLMRQRCFSGHSKQFMLKGSQIDANDDKVKKSFEYVHRQAINNFNFASSKRSKSPEARINDSRLMLQKQLKNLPLLQLQKIHEILTAGGIIVQQEKLNQKNTNSPCYQNLLDSHNESYIKIKFKQDDQSGNKATGNAQGSLQVNGLEGSVRKNENRRNQKLAFKKLNIANLPLELKMNKDGVVQHPESKTTTKLSEEELIREAIVNKIMCEEKTAQSIMVDGEEQKLKKSINLYQEGLSIIEDIQANITETITDNDNQFIQYQEVGSINNMFNSKFDQSRDTGRQYTQIKMMAEESNSPHQNQTQSINSPNSLGCIVNEYTIPNMKEDSTVDFQDKRALEVKKSQTTLGRAKVDDRSPVMQQTEPPSAVPSRLLLDQNKITPFDVFSTKLRNRNLSVLSKQNAHTSLNFMDEDQTDNQTIYLGQRAGSNACGPIYPSGLASNHQKNLKQMLKAATNQQSRNEIEEQSPKLSKKMLVDQNTTYHQTQPINESYQMNSELQNYLGSEQTDRKVSQQPLNKQEQIQYQSFGRIVPTITIEGSKSQIDKHVVAQQQQVKTGGGKTSLTALVDPDNDNQSPKTYTNISYNMDHDDGNFSAKENKQVGTSMQGSDKNQKLVLNNFTQKQLKCETNRKTQELIVNNSSTINERIVNRSKNSVTYKRLNEDLDIDLQRANMDIEYEDMLDSSIKDPAETKSTQVKNKKKLNTGLQNLQDTQQLVIANDNHTLGSQKYSNTMLADLNSPQQFNPKIYDMKRYSHEDRKSLDYIDMAKQDKLDSDSIERSRTQNNEYNKIQKLTAEIQISRRTHFNQSNATQIERSDNSFINTDLINHTILTTTLNQTKGGVTCAKYLQSTCSTRPKSQGIMGSQKLGKKILHQNLANYELYMQLKQMQNVGKQIGVQVQGDNNSSEPTIRDQGTLTHQPFVYPLDESFIQKLYRQESGKAPYNSEAHTKRSGHLFSQVSQKMKEAFMGKQQPPQMAQTMTTSGEVKETQQKTMKDRIQKYQGNGAAHHRRFNTLSVEFQKHQHERLQNQSTKQKQRKNTLFSGRVQQREASHSLYSPKSHHKQQQSEKRPFSSTTYDDMCRSNDTKLKNFREKMNENSLYQQYFDPACRLINQQRFLNKMNQQHLKEQSLKNKQGKIGPQVNHTAFQNQRAQHQSFTQAPKQSHLHEQLIYSRPKLNILKVITPSFYEKQTTDGNNQYEYESELMLQ